MRFLPPPEKNIVSGNVFCNYFLLLKNIRIFTGYFCPASIDPVFLTMRCYPYPISGFRNSCVSLRSIVFQNMNTARHFSLPGWLLSYKNGWTAAAWNQKKNFFIFWPGSLRSANSFWHVFIEYFARGYHSKNLSAQLTPSPFQSKKITVPAAGLQLSAHEHGFDLRHHIMVQKRSSRGQKENI